MIQPQTHRITMANKTIFKYAGNKAKVMAKISPYFKWDGVTAYFEPFCGTLGSALNVEIPEEVTNVMLSDENWEVINVHKMFIRQPGLLEEKVNALPFGEDAYYEIRNKDREEVHFEERTKDIDQAARTLYLNKNCFNGLMRYNPKKGYFNVPWNHAKKKAVVNLTGKDMQYARDFLASERVCVKWLGFEQHFDGFGKGDLVYCDPPYISIKNPKQEFVGFVGNFDRDKQSDLAKAGVDAHKRGAKVYISNSDCPASRGLYAFYGYRIVEVKNVQRSLSSKGTSRKKVGEILAILD